MKRTLIATCLMLASTQIYGASNQEKANRLIVCAASYHAIQIMLSKLDGSGYKNPELAMQLKARRKALLAKTAGLASRKYILDTFFMDYDKIMEFAIDELDSHENKDLSEIIYEKYNPSCSKII